MRITGRSRFLLRVALTLALGLVLAACSSDGDSDEGGGSTTGSDGGSASAISMTIKDFAFDPSELTGSAGQALEIDLSNQDDVEHSFTLDDDSVSQDVEGGESTTVGVTLPESGTLGWHCEYHPTMTGTITVS